MAILLGRQCLHHLCGARAPADARRLAHALAIANRRHDARRQARLGDDHDRVWLGAVEIPLDELVTAASRRLNDRDIALAGPTFEPGLKVLGNAAQHVSAHQIELPVGLEKADNPLRLLERLDQPIGQNPVEAPLMPANAVPVMLAESVHERPPLVPTPAEYRRSRSALVHIHEAIET